MALNSIITNASAQVALASLNNVTSELNSTQKAVSTGYIVADADDNGAAFAVAQNVRSSVTALTASNQTLGESTGLLSVTEAGLTSIQTTLSTVQATLVELASGLTAGSARTQDIAQLKTNVSQIATFLTNANFIGASLIGNTTLAEKNAKFGAVTVSENELGNQFTLTTFSGSALLSTISNISTGTSTAAAFAAYLTTSGSFSSSFNSVGTALNSYGNLSKEVNNQISFNTAKITSLQTGVGALVDANEAAESATLQSLQIQQQLATSALSIANQTPSLLTKLIQ
jgi:flagellin